LRNGPPHRRRTTRRTEPNRRCGQPRCGPRCSGRVTSFVQIFAHQPVENTIHPLAVPPIAATPQAFLHEAPPLGVTLRPLVETVDLELQTMEIELEQQVALEDPRRAVGEPAPAEVRMDREIPEIRDPGAAVREREAERACALPLGAVLDLDHEAA